uniref:WGS project CAEQ00000000 data, annotated contig 936 n=1 Tax=Trypanosoma congolense (strain IL3000) TaxID=1068625 RepID=F9WJQ6_TRYCI|nr:unnamed protein product [Trypanosoma congolense IL3000]
MSNNAGSALAQQTSLSIESPAERSVVLHQSPSSAAIDLPTNNTLVPTTATTALQDPANNSQGTRVGNTAGQVGRYAATNDFANDYSAGMGYNGLGMSGLGYGGLGMGGMYGGLGMGGMYGGLGMGGMYGGLGMGGMYGGLGMGGMYGMGMSEDFQRSQMTFMLVGRLLEMCGMFAGVIQMTFGSALQFMGSYIGMSQQYNKLQSGMYVDEGGRWVELPKRNDSTEASAGSSANRTISRRSRQTTRSGMLLGVLRRLLFMLIAVSLVRRFIR